MGKKKKNFYAVAKGRATGIFTAWSGPGGAQQATIGFGGARYAGFATKQQAEAWLAANSTATAPAPPAPPAQLFPVFTLGRGRGGAAAVAALAAPAPQASTASRSGGDNDDDDGLAFVGEFTADDRQRAAQERGEVVAVTDDSPEKRPEKRLAAALRKGGSGSSHADVIDLVEDSPVRPPAQKRAKNADGERAAAGGAVKQVRGGYGNGGVYLEDSDDSDDSDGSSVDRRQLGLGFGGGAAAAASSAAAATAADGPGASDDPASRFPLDDDQSAALQAVLRGENVFITGVAGTGKSWLVQRIQLELTALGRTYTTLAPTGIAAVNVHGTTLHSFTGIGVPRRHKDFEKMWKQKERLRKCDVWIVDEVICAQAC